MWLLDYYHCGIHIYNSSVHDPKVFQPLFQMNPSFHLHSLWKWLHSSFRVELRLSDNHLSPMWIEAPPPALSIRTQFLMMHVLILPPFFLVIVPQWCLGRFPNSDGYGTLNVFVGFVGKTWIEPPPLHRDCVVHATWLDINPVVANLSYQTNYALYYAPYSKIHKCEAMSNAKVHISENQFLGGFIHFYDVPVVANAHQINHIALDFENLVAYGLDSWKIKLQALWNMVSQTGIALEYALAPRGGVCHIICSECFSLMNQATSPGFDLWSWRPCGGW